MVNKKHVKNIFKNILQCISVAFFLFFVALPAFYPQESQAEDSSFSKRLERRAKARQRSAARLMKRALSKEVTTEQSSDLLQVAAARCARVGANYLCTDGQGGTTLVETASDCGDCAGNQPGNSCEDCCDQIAGGRVQLCKDAAC